MHLHLQSILIASFGITLIANVSVLPHASWKGFKHADTRLSTAVHPRVLKSCMAPAHLQPAFHQLMHRLYANRTIHLPRDLFQSDLAFNGAGIHIVWTERPVVHPALPLDETHAVAQLWYNPFVFSPHTYELNENRRVVPPFAQQYPLRILFFSAPGNPAGAMQMIRFGNTLAIVPLGHDHEGVN
jgi:hypothetical protein